jgi:hypothetical protein
MPIVPAFNPDTGASGGPPAPAGAVGFQWRQILDFATLTFSDPNSLVTSYSVASGLHSVTLATLGASNVDYNYGSGANFTGARWTFPLTYQDGSPVVAGDTFNLHSKVTDYAVGAARNYNIAFAAVQNPTSTVLTTMDALGCTFGMTGVGTPLTGTWRRNVVGTTSLAGGVTVYGQSLFGGLPGKAKVAASALIQSASAAAPTNGLDANILTAADNAQMYAIIAVGTLGTVTTTGGQVDFKLYFAVDKLS